MKERILKVEHALEGLTRLSWEDESGRRVADEYLLTAGSVPGLTKCSRELF